MKVLKQSSDFNCGAYALHFLLGLYGVECGVEEVEKRLCTTEKNGTSHEDIKRVLKHFNFNYTSFENSNLVTLKTFLPAIINYQYDEDGHYSVILGKGNGFFVLYNPYNGEVEKINDTELEKTWYSDRYGAGFLLQIINSN